MSHKISSDGSTCVDPDYFWQSIDVAPMGVKVQLLSKHGVAAYGTTTTNTLAEGFWTHWAPLPKVKKENT